MKLASLAAAWLGGMALAYRWYDADPGPALLLAAAALTLALILRLARLDRQLPRQLPHQSPRQSLHQLAQRLLHRLTNWILSPWPALLLALLFLGLWRYETVETPPPSLVAQSEQQATLRGRIVNDPEATATRIKFRLEVWAIDRGQNELGQNKVRQTVTPRNWEPQSGKVLVYADPPHSLVRERESPYFRYGDRLELAGTLQQPQPFAGFDYPAYLESLDIYGIMWTREAVWLADREGKDGDFGGGNADGKGNGNRNGDGFLFRAGTAGRAGIYDLRRKLAKSLDSALPPSQAALAQGLLLGQRGQLPDAAVENFRQTGTSHLLAISGLHLGILLALSVGLFSRIFGRHTPLYLLLTLALIWLYALISGAPASVVRAAIMGSIYLFVLAQGRPRDTLLPALALSAVAMTALNPQIISQIAFQLSFAAMAGIVLALPGQAAVSESIVNRFSRVSQISLPNGGNNNNHNGLWGRWGRWQRWQRWSPWVGYLLGWTAAGVIISVAATLATFPLVAFNFKQLPLLGIPTTILATPLLPFALIGSLAAALSGLVHPVLGQVIGGPASIPLSALLKLVELVPGWTVTGNWDNSGLVWVWYITLALILLLVNSRAFGQWISGRWSFGSGTIGGDNRPVNQPTEYSPSPPAISAAFRRQSFGAYLSLAGIALILAVSGIYLWVEVFNGSDGKLHVYFFDVGQGDSTLIVTPQGRQVLVDGGPEIGSATRALSGPLSPWDRRLDLVILTHLDADHSRGLLKALETYRVDAVLAGAKDEDSYLYPQWRQTVERQEHRVAYLSAGQTITLEEGITLETLHPPAEITAGRNNPAARRPAPDWDADIRNANNKSVVLRLVYGEVSFLLTGDIELEAERYLVRTAPNLESRVFKVAHHGSKTSTTPAFLRAVNPRWAVISAGRDNPYGHPHPSVLARLEAAVGPSSIYQTANQGTIDFSTDGFRIWVKTER